MSYINISDLKKQIKEKNFKKLYFFYGEEKFLIKHYVNKIISLLVDKQFSTFNYQKLDFQNYDIDSLFDAITSIPFMAEKKCVVFLNLDMEKIDKVALKKLKEIIKNIPDTTTFIINQNIIEMNTKKSSKWKSFLKYINDYGNIIEFKHLNKSDLSKLLISWAKKRNVVLNQSISYKLIEKCGNDLTLLKNEMEKICAFIKDGEVTEEILDNITISNIEANVFELTKSIIAGNASKAYRQLDTLFYEKEEPVAILAVLASSYIDMYRVKVAIENKNPISVISKNFDYRGKEFKLDIASRNCHNISMNSLRKSINLLTEADFKLKSSKLKSRIIMDKLIATLIAT